MNVIWNELYLSDEFINSTVFQETIEKNLKKIWPLGGITNEWISTVYDIWYRHLIPLDDFMMTPKEAVSKFGLLHFSGDEDPKKLEIYWRKRETIQKETIDNIENKIRELESQCLSKISDKLKLDDLRIELKYMSYIDDFDEIIRRGYEDIALREETIKLVGNRRSDPRRYVMIHHCFDNAKTLYLMLNNLFPEVKWNLIVAPDRHALITSGTPKQLKEYLYHNDSINFAEFLIAEPIVPERHDLVALMGNPDKWIYYQNTPEIL